LKQRSSAVGQRAVRFVHHVSPGGSTSPDSGVTFEELAGRYVGVKEPRWGAHAAATAKSVIQKHLIGNFGHRRVDEVTADEIQLFVNRMVRNNASHSLLKKAVVHLRAILELASDLDIIERNPMRNSGFKLEFKSQKQKSERCLSLKECRDLLSALFGRDRLIIRMFIQLGLRPEELFALRRNDIDGEFIRIDEVFTKGQVRELTPVEPGGYVYAPAGLLQELRAWIRSTRGGNSDWLFPAVHRRGSAWALPIGADGFRNHVLKPAAERAGIADVDLLTLRRTCGAHFGQNANAKDTQAQMRLSGLDVRERSPHRLPESLKRVAAALEAEILADRESCPASSK
jgi:integrase